MIEMTTQQHQQTARIYTFPPGGRDAARSQRTHEVTKPMTAAQSRFATALCTDSWYHAAAIEDDDKADT